MKMVINLDRCFFFVLLLQVVCGLFNCFVINKQLEIFVLYFFVVKKVQFMICGVFLKF